MVGRMGLVLHARGFLSCAGKPQPRVKITYTRIRRPPRPRLLPRCPGPPPAGARRKRESACPSRRSHLHPRGHGEGRVAGRSKAWPSTSTANGTTARKSLNDARLILLEADLPDFWKKQGLAAIRSGLPEKLRHYDLEAVAKELERTDRPNAAELAERAAVEREVRRILRQFGDTSPDETLPQRRHLRDPALHPLLPRQVPRVLRALLPAQAQVLADDPGGPHGPQAARPSSATSPSSRAASAPRR